jgi:hypothetical protein
LTIALLLAVWTRVPCTLRPEIQKFRIKKKRLIEEFNKLFPSIEVKSEYYLGAFYGGCMMDFPSLENMRSFQTDTFYLLTEILDLFAVVY